ncbi:MAG TPA: hypothetical protein VIY47_13045 [Ignavibacteriaceae bacterium]
MNLDNFLRENSRSLLKEYENKKIVPFPMSDSDRKRGEDLLFYFFSHCSDLQVGLPVNLSRKDTIQNLSRGAFSPMMLNLMQQLWPVIPDGEQVPDEQKQIATSLFSEFEQMYKYIYIYHRMDTNRPPPEKKKLQF